MSYFKSIVALTLGFGLVLASCSQQEPLAPSVESNIEAPTNQQTEPTEVISLSLEAGFAAKEEGSNLRALDGSTFYRGRLRPYITEDSVKILVFLGSATQFNKQELKFSYDKASNSVHYRGNLSVPKGLLQAKDLKMLLVVANERKINGNTLTMQDVNSEVFKNKLFADNETLPIDVPYFSDWIEVSDYVDGQLLDVARTKVLLRPQGHIIKLELSSTVTALRDISLIGLQIESNAITENGTYTLPSEVGHVGQAPVFTPQLEDPQHKFRKIKLPIDDGLLDNNTTRTIYLWVEKIPGARDPWTRTFAKVELAKPILDPTFAVTAWWDGHPSRELKNRKLYPVYYTNSTFDQTGSTMTMKLDNTTVISPIDRMAYTYASSEYSDRGYAGGPNLELGMGRWDQREWTDYSNYTWQWLVDKNYVGDAPTDIVIPNAQEPNSRTAKFYVPTLEEFHAVLPTDASLSPLFKNPGGPVDRTIDIQERAKIGNRNTAPKVFQSSFKYYIKIGGNDNGFLGIRFKGGDNRHKTAYQYRVLRLGNSGTGAIQIQTFYLGDFYPEIQTPDDFRAFTRNYPGATLTEMRPVERMLPFNRNHWSRIQGNLYWLNKSDGTNASYVEWDLNAGSIGVKTIDFNTNRTHETALLLMRDL